MKIGVDALGLPPKGGAHTATVGWLKALARADPTLECVVFLSRRETELDAFPNLHQRVITGLGTRLRLRLWAQLRLPLLLGAERVQLAHFMKNLSVFGIPCPNIVTILDLSRFKVPRGFSRLDIFLWRTIQPYILRMANRIVAISENTKRDLILEYGLPAEKIVVIYPSSDIVDRLAFRDSLMAERVGFALPSHFILNVGGRATHKNLYTLVRAFLLLKIGGFPHKLVIVGGQYHFSTDPRVHELLDQSGEKDVLFIGAVSDEELVSIYQAADLFVLPSLYEGFGLAPLEAMACGVPVIVTRRGALPEVVGEAGLYLDDPFDAEKLAQIMAKVLTSHDLQTEMIRRGREQATLFTWQRAAAATLRLYREILSNG